MKRWSIPRSAYQAAAAPSRTTGAATAASARLEADLAPATGTSVPAGVSAAARRNIILAVGSSLWLLEGGGRARLQVAAPSIVPRTRDLRSPSASRRHVPVLLRD